MFQRLTIVLAQVKAGNTSKYLVTEICQIIFILSRSNAKKVNNNIMNSMKL